MKKVYPRNSLKNLGWKIYINVLKAAGVTGCRAAVAVVASVPVIVGVNEFDLTFGGIFQNNDRVRGFNFIDDQKEFLKKRHNVTDFSLVPKEDQIRVHALEQDVHRMCSDPQPRLFKRYIGCLNVK